MSRFLGPTGFFFVIVRYIKYNMVPIINSYTFREDFIRIHVNDKRKPENRTV